MIMSLMAGEDLWSTCDVRPRAIEILLCQLRVLRAEQLQVSSVRVRVKVSGSNEIEDAHSISNPR